MAPKRVVHWIYRLRWSIVVGAVLGMSIAIVLLSLLYSDARATNARQEAALTAAQALIKSQADIRASEARQAAAAKVTAGYSECKARKAGTVLGNNILAQIRGIITDIQSAATNPAVIASLKERAKALPTFPTPHCATGPPPKKKEAIVP